MKKGIWISYDLGIKGDYQSLYEWLDSYDAKECGNSIAYLQFEMNEDLIKELKIDIESRVNFSNGDRVYIIYKSADNKIRGTFIRGGRKASPWTGYAPTNEQTIDNVD